MSFPTKAKEQNNDYLNNENITNSNLYLSFENEPQYSPPMHYIELCYTAEKHIYGKFNNILSQNSRQWIDRLYSQLCSVLNGITTTMKPNSNNTVTHSPTTYSSLCKDDIFLICRNLLEYFCRHGSSSSTLSSKSSKSNSSLSINPSNNSEKEKYEYESMFLPLQGSILDFDRLRNFDKPCTPWGTKSSSSSSSSLNSDLELTSNQFIAKQKHLLIGQFVSNVSDQIRMQSVYLRDSAGHSISCVMLNSDQSMLKNIYYFQNWTFIPCNISPSFSNLLHDQTVDPRKLDNDFSKDYLLQFSYLELESSSSIRLNNNENSSETSLSFASPQSLFDLYEPKSVAEIRMDLNHSRNHKSIYNLVGFVSAISPPFFDKKHGKYFFSVWMSGRNEGESIQDNFEQHIREKTIQIVFKGSDQIHLAKFLQVSQSFIVTKLKQSKKYRKISSHHNPIITATQNTQIIPYNFDFSFTPLSPSPNYSFSSQNRTPSRESKDGTHSSCINSPVEQFLSPPSISIPSRSLSSSNTSQSSIEPDSSSSPCHASPSKLLSYRGQVTKSLGDAMYEIDGKYILYITHFQLHFGEGLRSGANIQLDNVHPVIHLDSLFGFACCMFSSIRILSFSTNPQSPFVPLIHSKSLLFPLRDYFPVHVYPYYVEILESCRKSILSEYCSWKTLLPKSSPSKVSLGVVAFIVFRNLELLGWNENGESDVFHKKMPQIKRNIKSEFSDHSTCPVCRIPRYALFEHCKPQERPAKIISISELYEINELFKINNNNNNNNNVNNIISNSYKQFYQQNRISYNDIMNHFNRRVSLVGGFSVSGKNDTQLLWRDKTSSINVILFSDHQLNNLFHENNHSPDDSWQKDYHHNLSIKHLTNESNLYLIESFEILTEYYFSSENQSNNNNNNNNTNNTNNTLTLFIKTSSITPIIIRNESKLKRNSPMVKDSPFRPFKFVRTNASSSVAKRSTDSRTANTKQKDHFNTTDLQLVISDKSELHYYGSLLQFTLYGVGFSTHESFPELDVISVFITLKTPLRYYFLKSGNAYLISGVTYQRQTLKNNAFVGDEQRKEFEIKEWNEFFDFDFNKIPLTYWRERFNEICNIQKMETILYHDNNNDSHINRFSNDINHNNQNSKSFKSNRIISVFGYVSSISNQDYENGNLNQDTISLETQSKSIEFKINRFRFQLISEDRCQTITVYITGSSPLCRYLVVGAKILIRSAFKKISQTTQQIYISANQHTSITLLSNPFPLGENTLTIDFDNVIFSSLISVYSNCILSSLIRIQCYPIILHCINISMTCTKCNHTRLSSNAQSQCSFCGDSDDNHVFLSCNGLCTIDDGTSQVLLKIQDIETFWKLFQITLTDRKNIRSLAFAQSLHYSSGTSVYDDLNQNFYDYIVQYENKSIRMLEIVGRVKYRQNRTSLNTLQSNNMEIPPPFPIPSFDHDSSTNQETRKNKNTKPQKEYFVPYHIQEVNPQHYCEEFLERLEFDQTNSNNE